MREKYFHRAFKGVNWICDSCSAQYSREPGNNSWSRKYVKRNGYPMETARSVKRERSRNATASCETVTTNVVLAGRQSMSTNWQAFLAASHPMKFSREERSFSSEAIPWTANSPVFWSCKSVRNIKTKDNRLIVTSLLILILDRNENTFSVFWQVSLWRAYELEFNLYEDYWSWHALMLFVSWEENYRNIYYWNIDKLFDVT